MGRTKHIGYEKVRERYRGRTPAQTYCFLAGAALLIAGAVGFFVDSGWETGGDIDGDQLIGLEVNAWHNLVHLLSGFVLLAAWPRRGAAKVVALAFGLTYGIVAVVGLVDGETFIGLLPVNTADNVLHIALAAVGVLAAIASDSPDHGPPADQEVPRTTGRRVESTFAPYEPG